MIVMKFGGTSVADRAAIERLIAIVRAARQAAIQPESARLARADRRGLGARRRRPIGCSASRREAGAGDVEGARRACRALCGAAPRRRASVITDDAQRAAVERVRRRRVRRARAHRRRARRAARSLAALARRHRRDRRDPQQPHRRRGADRRTDCRPRWVDAREADRHRRRAHGAPRRTSTETTAALTTHASIRCWPRGRIPVIGGFVGATRDGVTTTLGRGGSDYSAAIVGAVPRRDGDPDLDRRGRHAHRRSAHRAGSRSVVPHLSFAEASELAYFGAKVLHPATIQPAVARNIPVRILNSRRPQARGTLITARAAAEPTGR